MPNRKEYQDKGKGCGRSPNTGMSDGQGESHKGYAAVIRFNKREEANERNSRTPVERTRKYRLAQAAMGA